MFGQLVLVDRDLIRMTFVVGVAVSVMLYERTHRTTGSIVVPGYIGVQLLNPSGLLMTAANAILTYILVSKVLPRFTIVYGRARFVLNIAVSVALSLMFKVLLGTALPLHAASLETIGYVIPALIAYDMNRQGPRKTGSAVLLSGVLAALPAIVIVAISPGVVDPLLPFDSGLVGVAEFWLPLAALLSASVSTLLLSGHRLRCGGFIGAMYLGMSAVNPLHTLFLVAMALLTYSIVNYGLKPLMIMFGRRKFATMMMLGSMLSWLAVETIELFVPGGLRLADLPIAVLAVPVLLANDMERSSVAEVLTGSLIGAAATLSTLIVLTGVVDATSIPIWAPLLMIASLTVLALPWIEKAGWRRPRLPSLRWPGLGRGPARSTPLGLSPQGRAAFGPSLVSGPGVRAGRSDSPASRCRPRFAAAPR